MNSIASTTIDAHQHFWDRNLNTFDHSWQESPELSKICRTFLPDDLRPLLDQAQVARSIFVQTQHDTVENDWALDLAKTHPWICGVVGWVDLQNPDCEPSIEHYKSQPNFVGVRHITQDEPDPDFIVRDSVMTGLSLLEKHTLPFDLLFYPQHLRHAPTIARRFQDLRLVIDHLSKPQIAAGHFDDWSRDLKAAAKCENVFCKLSGLVTEADWHHRKVEDIRPYVDTALDCFGPQRLMYGSDWPVCELAASYDQVHALAKDCIAELSEAEQALVMGGTAASFYQISE